LEESPLPINPQATHRSFKLTERNIDVWPVHTAGSSAVAEELERVLAPDEKVRAAQFRFSHLRRSFILARGALRILLGWYLDVSPASIQFTYGSRGKPALAVPARVDFNVSHSGDLAVFAFTAGCEIGVDVEQIHPLQDIQTIADQFFCPEEAAELMSLTANQRERSFFLCWTRKEAYIKAIGDGLSAPLDGFRVTLQQGQPARFIHIANDMGSAQAWTLHDLQLAPGYAAALAYRDTERLVAVSQIIDPAELLSIPKRPLD
jgi:4'-phosphopantetheinyl transferase